MAEWNETERKKREVTLDILMKSRMEWNKADFLTFFNSSMIPPFRMLLDQFICILITDTVNLAVSLLRKMDIN